MKVHLMFADQDFDVKQALPPNHPDLRKDLELNTLLDAMAQGDNFVHEICSITLLVHLDNVEEINYRQEILKDCLNNPEIIRALYQIPIKALTSKKRHWMGILTHSPSGVLYSAVEIMDMYLVSLKELREISDLHAEKFRSDGFTRFFNMIKTELDDDYFALVEDHLQQLRFKNGVLISAELGHGNEGTNLVLRQPFHKRGWIKQTFSLRNKGYTFVISDRDDNGQREINDIKNRGLNSSANAVAQAADHIEDFINALWTELAFYIGCLNLNDRLTGTGNPFAFPVVVGLEEQKRSLSSLYDVCLALTLHQPVIGNDVNADGKTLVIITGANQGGKSTFLRSIGLVQLMAQAGMFIAAQAGTISLCSGIFTHYKRKEDANMKSGKLDEELARMSQIVNWIEPNSLMLFNESFAATNEREGSEIARQITNALLARQISVYYVTHMYDLARSYYEKAAEGALFLRAGRKSSGNRTFKLTEGEPLPTSYGIDLYKNLFEH